jgi:hypothetical protein
LSVSLVFFRQAVENRYADTRFFYHFIKGILFFYIKAIF